MNTGEHLIRVGETGVALSIKLDSEDVYNLLNVLLDIEDVLDSGRALSDRESIPRINQVMDELRKNIRGIMNTCKKDELRDFMDRRGNRLKVQFSI